MSKKKKTTTQVQKVPEWLESGSKLAVDMGKRIANRPYQEYEGQRFAELDPNEQAAIEMAATEGGQYRGDVERAREFAERGGQSFLDADIQAYMNPYIESALEPAAREMREEGMRRQVAAGQEAAMASAFGGSRAAIMTSEASGKSLEAISDLYERGYASAFESAANRFDQDRVSARAAADQFLDVGERGQQMLSNEMNNLLVTGGLRRQLEQVNLDFDYMEFVEARDWDITNLQPLLAALSTVPYTKEQTTTEQTSGGTFQAVLGAATTVAAAYFTGGLSTMIKAKSGGGEEESDIRLKDNVELIGKYGEFNWYRWDWNDAAKAIGCDENISEGVMADEVIVTRPDLVGRRNGYLTVDYGRICHG